MIGITIGIGGEWAALARRTAERMEAMTGLPCHVIDHDDFGCSHPSWLKCHVHRIFPNEESFFVFDADILPLRPWDPASMFYTLGRPVMAVPEPNDNPDLLKECQEWCFGYPDCYLNAGLLIFGREHVDILERAWSMHPNGGRWLEQSAFNRAIIDSGHEVCRLPRHFNMIAQRGRVFAMYARTTLRHAYCVHTCALGSPQAVTEAHQRILAHMQLPSTGKTRTDMLWDMRRRFHSGSRGAEVGVFDGSFSHQITNIMQPGEFHMVDLFAGPCFSGDENGRNIRLVDLSPLPGRLRFQFPQAQIHQMDSTAWLTASAGMDLDWIYLDTSHEYEQTLSELRAASHVIRKGGVIAGHDFSSAFPGVVQAVQEFCAESGAEFSLYDGDLLPSYLLSFD